MNAATPLDQNDRLRAGTLPADPGADAVPMHAETPAKKRKLAVDPAAGPAAIVAEQALLAALLWNGSFAPDAMSFAHVRDLVDTGSMFAARDHGIIFDAILALGAEVKPADQHLVQQKITERGDVIAGIIGYVEELVESASATSEPALRGYAEAIRNAWAKRQLVAVAKRLDADARKPTAVPSAIVEGVSASLGKLAHDTASEAGFARASTVVSTVLRTAFSEERPVILSTGLRDLDEKAPLMLKDVTIIAARTSRGKSMLATQIAFNVAQDPASAALYVSLEMSKEKFIARAVAARAHVPYDKIRKKLLSSEDRGRITTAAMEIARDYVYFTDRQTQTLMSIMAVAQKVQNAAMHPEPGQRPRSLVMIVIDTIHLVKPRESTDNRRRDRFTDIAEISRGLRWLAEQTRCHVIALAQIGRAAEKDTDKTPRIHQIKECGNIEDDADNVLLIDRDYDKFNRPKDDIAKIIVAKQRDGETGIVWTTVNTSQMRFENYVQSGGYTPGMSE